MHVLQKKKSILEDLPICSSNNTENDLLNLVMAACGSRAMQTLTHKLFFCNKDNISHITWHLEGPSQWQVYLNELAVKSWLNAAEHWASANDVEAAEGKTRQSRGKTGWW